MIMVDHGQTVMVIPWLVMVKSDILMMISQGLNDDELTMKTYHQSDHGQTMVDHSQKWLSGGLL